MSVLIKWIYQYFRARWLSLDSWICDTVATGLALASLLARLTLMMRRVPISSIRSLVHVLDNNGNSRSGLIVNYFKWYKKLIPVPVKHIVLGFFIFLVENGILVTICERYKRKYWCTLYQPPMYSRLLLKSILPLVQNYCLYPRKCK